MSSQQKTARIVGALLLIVFISGVIVFQFLQGPTLFSENYLTATAENARLIIGSVVTTTFSGVTTVIIAALLLPIFKRHSPWLAYLYLAFCVLNFVAVMIDNVSVVAMLELSREYVRGGNEDSFELLGRLVYEQHYWTHYFYLLISCFPVFVLYYLLYRSRLVPRWLSVFGIAAVVLMFVEEIFSVFGHGISMNLLLPIALVQLTLPLWLIFKGLQLPGGEGTEAA